MNDNRAIIEKIISDAEKSAEQTVSAAVAAAEKAVEDANAIADAQLATVRADAEESGESILARRATLAGLDGKKAVLFAKQTVISAVFDKVLSALCSAPEEAYFALIKRLAESAAEEGDTIILSENAPFAAEKLEGALGGKVRVLKQGKFKGGAVVSGEKRDTDFSFEALVADYYERHSGDVARAIFRNE